MRRASLALALSSASALGMALLLGCVGDGSSPPPLPSPSPDAGDDGPHDAGHEAGQDADADAGPRTWCSEQPNAGRILVCEDFDLSGDVGSRGWANEVSSVSAPEIGSTLRRSEPSALRVAVPANAAGNRSSRIVRTANVTANTTRWIYEADILLNQWESPGTGPNDAVSIHGFALSSGTDTIVNLTVRSGAGATCIFNGDGASSAAPAPVPFSVAVWHHVKLEVAKAANGYDVTCNVDGAASVITGKPATITNDRRLPLGLVVHGSHGRIEAAFDNVVFRAE